MCKVHNVVAMIGVMLKGNDLAAFCCSDNSVGTVFKVLSRILRDISILTCGVLAVVRTAFRSIAGKVTRGSLNVAKLAIFWTGVFIAARFVLESN